jgi:NADP-dependent 3-hydroxy acid dehydrogenase YdfG
LAVTTFSGRVCVVTGATGGIGRALTVALAGAGAHVWAVGRSAERLDALVAGLPKGGGKVARVVADFEHGDDVDAAGRAILAAADRVDVLVHAAGAITLGRLTSASVDDFDRQYRVNLRAPLALTQALLPLLTRSRGQVVFVNSSAALAPGTSNGQYAATKAGLKAIADSLRQEVNAEGVRVVSVYAGRTATPMQESLHEHEGRPYRPEFLLRAEDVVEVVLGALSLPESGEVTDVSVRPMRKLPAAPERPA